MQRTRPYWRVRRHPAAMLHVSCRIFHDARLAFRPSHTLTLLSSRSHRQCPKSTGRIAWPGPFWLGCRHLNCLYRVPPSGAQTPKQRTPASSSLYTRRPSMPRSYLPSAVARCSAPFPSLALMDAKCTTFALAPRPTPEAESALQMRPSRKTGQAAGASAHPGDAVLSLDSHHCIAVATHCFSPSSRLALASDLVPRQMRGVIAMISCPLPCAAVTGMQEAWLATS